MKISFLIPSKNRLNLLRHAVKSIQDQENIDFEIVISDNASEEPYQAYVTSLGDARIKYFRHTEPVPVTANWTKALSLASGDYVLMLGDDDALAPAFAEQVSRFVCKDGPEILYLAAYHYAYPGVFSPGDVGYMARLWWEFVDSGDGPFCLLPVYARDLAKSVLEFRHRYGYNAQHFLLKRSFIENFSAIGGIYQSPYPDFFSAMILFHHARDIVVVPTESVIIGISPKSFGAYYVSQRESEGYDFLDNRHIPEPVREFLEKTEFPGDFNNTNWLISAEMARRAVGTGFEAGIDVDRYHVIQMLSLLRDEVLIGRPRDAAFAQVALRLSRREGFILEMLKAALQAVDVEQRGRLLTAIGRTIEQYPPSGYRNVVDIGQHQHISDAIMWLKSPKHPSPVQEQVSSPIIDDTQRSSSDVVEEMAQSQGARIIVTRQNDDIVLLPQQFDDFAFADGDRLRVIGLENTEHKFTPDQCVSLRASTGEIIRVPPIMQFSSFHGFDLHEHLVLLRDAGTNTLESIGVTHIELYRKHMGIFPDMTFLEIGSGIGRDAIQLMSIFPQKGRYIGIDVTRESVVWCSKNITLRNPNMVFFHFDLQHELYNPLGSKKQMDFELQIESSTVDRVSLGAVLTNLFEDEIVHYLSEIRRVLKPTGMAYAKFFLYSPETIESVIRTNVSGLRFAHPFASGCFVQDINRPNGAVSYTDEAIKRMLSQADLELVKPYLVGSWSGRSEQPDGEQDAFVVRPSKRSLLRKAIEYVRR